eukprot:568674-Alexandrium_andersonii.AAC.1
MPQNGHGHSDTRHLQIEGARRHARVRNSCASRPSSNILNSVNSRPRVAAACCRKSKSLDALAVAGGGA